MQTSSFRGEVSTVATTTWVTRRPPRWRTEERFTPEVGREVVARVEARVRAGLPPESVVGATGLRLRAQEADPACQSSDLAGEL